MDLSRLVAALCLAGAGYAASGRLPRGWTGRLSRMLFYYVIPPTIFMSVLSAPSTTTMLILVGAACLHMVLITAPLLAWGRGDPFKTTVALLSGLPNAVFLAFPLSIALYGTVAPVLPYAVALNMLLPGVLALLGSRHNAGERPPTAYPHVAAFLAALLVKITAPQLATALTGFKPLREALAALNLTAFAIIGGELASSEKFAAQGVGLVALLRLVASPLLMAAIILPLSSSLGIPHVYLEGMMIQSLMPPAIANIILAHIYGLDVELAASAITLTTPVSIALALLVALYPA